MRATGSFVALAFLLAAAPAFADFPDVSNHSVPSHIHLVASDGVQPAVSLGEFEVIIRDLANNPIPGANVVVDFSASPDLRLCGAQLYPGVQLDCPNQRASAITDAAGRVRFTLLGNSNGAGGASTIGPGARIFANGTLIAFPSVSAYDLDGVAGVGGSDLAVFIGDFASGINWTRSDYDGSSIIGGGDLAMWLAAFATGSQLVSCATTCP